MSRGTAYPGQGGHSGSAHAGDRVVSFKKAPVIGDLQTSTR